MNEISFLIYSKKYLYIIGVLEGVGGGGEGLVKVIFRTRLCIYIYFESKIRFYT